MATTTFRLGDMTVHRIIEMECGFTPALEFLPKLTPQMLDDSRSWMKTPLALDDQDRLILCFQAYIVRTGKHIILVDSCVGNDKDRPARPIWHMKTDNVFMSGLAEVGLTVNDIDFVLCTHLHVDHVGWNTRLENGRWVPTFPGTCSRRRNWISGWPRTTRRRCRRSPTASSRSLRRNAMT
jgi:glyoxylase-like metal-dependent hydrolase (beta-lactamase superfamily II)